MEHTITKKNTPSYVFFDIVLFSFIVVCVTFILFLLVDTFVPGFVSDYFDMNVLKYLALAFAFILVFRKKQ